MCEYFAHRSIYHHKEADPYAWVIPRLRGQAKAALVAVEYDEFGAGRGEDVHARLFADLLAGAGLDDTYLHYLDAVPAPMLALVNMMSLFACIGSSAASWSGTSRVWRSARHPLRAAWSTRCGGWTHIRRVCVSTPNTWKPTRYTNR
ncbi:Uncharacterised protein [Nocardia africana]|uniref:Iron-containing redox enzyme family protein n=1 Tax=Nocardia africana TaxID=134964 RepID=A0A378WZE0_9NOCA|nr:Uncharacterised protein [Nocardia africana]